MVATFDSFDDFHRAICMLFHAVIRMAVPWMSRLDCRQKLRYKEIDLTAGESVSNVNILLVPIFKRLRELSTFFSCGTN